LEVKRKLHVAPAMLALLFAGAAADPRISMYIPPVSRRGA